MRLVYRAAQRVIIWLGASNEEIDCLYDWMAALDRQMLAVAQPHTISAWENQWAFVVWQLRDGTLPKEVHEALADLLRRDWFSRIWVLQEAALAGSAMITCGRKEINSRAFVVMPRLLRVECDDREQARLDILPGLLRAKSWWARESGRDLLTLLRKFGRSKASDTRDIIYALLGVSADAHSSDLLRPDYQRSTKEAIQHTVAYFMLQQGDISQNTSPQLMPQWSMYEFLDALHDLDYEVFKWAVEEAQDALLYDLIVCQRSKNNTERLDEYLSWTSYNGPLITIAIKKGNTNLIELLLQSSGANFQTRDPDGRTPVAVAVEHGNIVAAHLIMQRRQFTIPGTSSSPDCNTVIVAAAKQGALALRQLLLHDLRFINSASQFNGQTLLLTAAKNGDFATVEWILKHAGIDISAVDPSGDEVLRTRARSQWKNYNDRLVQVFRRGHRAGLSQLELQLILGFSVIISHFNFGAYTNEMVRKPTKADEFHILRRIVNVEGRLEEGGWFGFQSPLGHAAHAGNTSIVALLLDEGADINSRDCDELASTPLCNAARGGHLDTVKLLVERGANIKLTTETADESTALWCAASNGHTAIARCLLEAGASVKLTPDGSSTLPQSTVLLCSALSSGKAKAMKAIRALGGRGSDA